MSIKDPFPNGWTARELLDYEFPPQEWIIDNLLPAGLTFLIAKSKAGKSWMTLTLAVAAGLEKTLALGGKYRVAPTGVMYLDMEMSPRGSQKRLISVLDFYRQDGIERVPICMYGFNRWPKFDQGGLEKIEKFLDEHEEVRLVVIDTIGKVYPSEIRSKGRNAYYAEYDLFSSIKRIADERDIAIVGLHHQNKSSNAEDPLDKASGSAALVAVADAYWLLERPRGLPREIGDSFEKKTATLFVTGRELPERTIDLEWDNYAGWVATHDPLLDAKERNFYG